MLLIISFTLSNARRFTRQGENAATQWVKISYLCSSEDKVGQVKVAIKKFCRPFQSLIYAKRTYREIKLLRLMDHENIIGILDIFTPQQSMEDFQDVYIVTQLMGANLYNIKSQQLSDDHVKFLVYQILRGLKYIHSAGVIHRDLKPSNIAVNEDCELRILDLGLARMADNEMTEYVVNRWYRAPEIIFNWIHYSQTADIWSVGCIMAEFLTSKLLFPGRDRDMDQLGAILQLVGKPDQAFLNKISSETVRNYLAQMPEYEKRPFKDVFTGANEQAIDLLEQMLRLDADTRITVEAALYHPYLEIYADHDDEPVCEAKFVEPQFQSDDIDFWRKLTFDEIHDYRSSKQTAEPLET